MGVKEPSQGAAVSKKREAVSKGQPLLYVEGY